MKQLKQYDEIRFAITFIFLTLNTFPYYSSVGTKHRFRHILRDSLKPQGQCYSKLNESVSCYADACFTYTHQTLHDKNGYRKLQCIRLDGLIVEGELCHMCEYVYISFSSSHIMFFWVSCVAILLLLYVIKLFCKCLFSIKSNCKLRTVTSYLNIQKLFIW